MTFSLVVILGRLAADPEIRHTSSGLAICQFRVAHEHYKKDADNHVSFTTCTAFGKTAENISAHFGKGKPIHIVGRWEQSKWTDKEGSTRYSDKCVVDRFSFVPSDKSEEKPSGADYGDIPF